MDNKDKIHTVSGVVMMLLIIIFGVLLFGLPNPSPNNMEIKKVEQTK